MLHGKQVLCHCVLALHTLQNKHNSECNKNVVKFVLVWGGKQGKAISDMVKNVLSSFLSFKVFPSDCSVSTAKSQQS